MATAQYTFTPNQAGIDRLLHSESGPYGRWLAQVGNRVVNTAKERANVRTGLMRSRIEFRLETGPGNTLEGIVAARVNYSFWVDQGNGRYAGSRFLSSALADVLQSL